MASLFSVSATLLTFELIITVKSRFIRGVKTNKLSYLPFYCAMLLNIIVLIYSIVFLIRNDFKSNVYFRDQFSSVIFELSTGCMETILLIMALNLHLLTILIKF